MARTTGSGNGRLQEAMAVLLQNQATLLQTQAAFVAQMAETNRRQAETDRRQAETDRRLTELQQINAERFARIEALLLEHNRILEALPEAIRQKISFRSSEPTVPHE